MKKCMALMLLATLALPIYAGDTESVMRILEQQRQLAADIDSGVLKVAPEQATVITEEQSKVFNILRENDSLKGLRPDDRIALDTALQRINAALVGTRQADEDQRQCRSEKATGSHMRKMTCRTKGEWKRIAEEARAFKGRSFICAPPGCGESPDDTASRLGGAGQR
jgi:F0F1-type ATP synthase epsilon subunit